MAAKRARRAAGKPPEKTKANSETQKIDKKTQKTVEEPEESDARDQLETGNEHLEAELGPGTEVSELPFLDVEALPDKARSVEISKKGVPKKDVFPEKEIGYRNRAPLQADDRAKEILDTTLKNTISLTAMDLLNVSEPVRQELRKLLTKTRVPIEKKPIEGVAEPQKGIEGPWRNTDNPRNRVLLGQLPDATCEILETDREGLEKGAVIIGDPVQQYLSTLQPGERPKPIAAAVESQPLRAIYPVINGVGEVESLLDSGSQIISMASDVAKKLEITWDPDITIEMESANRSIERTLGLAKNVPFLCGYITVYLQIHIMANPAYKVLLGRPFDIITESVVKNEKDGSQTLTLTDQNTGERCVMHTYERGKVPDIRKRSIRKDFRPALMK